MLKHRVIRVFVMMVSWGICVSAQAQLDTVLVEVFYQDDGSIANYPDGATTYRIYAELTDATDALTAVFATEDHPVELGTTEEDALWNSTAGGVTGPNLNAALFGAFPESEYDSMVTIGRESSAAVGGGVTYVSSVPGPTVFDESFGDVEWAPNLNVGDGVWFSVVTEVNTYGQGDDLKVLLAQITTTAELDFKLNIQVMDGGIGGILQQYVWDETEVDVPGDEIDGSQLGLIYTGSGPGCSEVYFQSVISCNWNSDLNQIEYAMEGTQLNPQGCLIDSVVWTNSGDPLDIFAWNPGASAASLSTGTPMDITNLLTNLTEGENYLVIPWFTSASEEPYSGLTTSETYACTQVFGCLNEGSCNFDPEVTDSDESCAFNDNITLETAWPLHVYHTDETFDVEHSFSCTTVEQGLYYCFQASAAPVTLECSFQTENVDFELYDSGGTLLTSSDDFPENINVDVLFEDLVTDQVYTIRVLPTLLAEYGPKPVVVRLFSGAGQALEADLNEDGLVSALDMVTFLGEYGLTSELGDFDGNGFVDTADLLFLIFEIVTATSCY